MITVNLRDKNNIINITSVGKVPIRGKTSSNLYFHTPLELLLSSLGLCVGGHIISFCRINNINVNIFEEIVLLKDQDYILNISCPIDFSEENKNLLRLELEYCQIAKELKNKLIVNFKTNKTKTEELLKQPKSCCGN
ncbi:MAG: hypothetical protein M0R17_03245 [Candidatus Omnitrophica bacterium]|jgi:uncharacterized OsmC-like protein|nr:hypothetical protein [Candidatus Omnitrophota bacterium]